MLVGIVQQLMFMCGLIKEGMKDSPHGSWNESEQHAGGPSIVGLIWSVLGYIMVKIKVVLVLTNNIKFDLQAELQWGSGGIQV